MGPPNTAWTFFDLAYLGGQKIIADSPHPHGASQEILEDHSPSQPGLQVGSLGQRVPGFSMPAEARRVLLCGGLCRRRQLSAELSSTPQAGTGRSPWM